MIAWPCTATLLIDDDRVRVPRFDFERGQETGWHCHAHEYVIPALTDCAMHLTEPGGSVRDVMDPPGSACRRAEELDHIVTCAGTAMSFIEVELKEKAAAVLPAAAPFPQVRSVRHTVSAA